LKAVGESEELERGGISHVAHFYWHFF